MGSLVEGDTKGCKDDELRSMLSLGVSFVWGFSFLYFYLFLRWKSYLNSHLIVAK